MKCAHPSHTKRASELIALLTAARDAYGDPPVYFGVADEPTLITGVVPAYRNERSGQISAGTGETCKRIVVII